MFKWQAVSVLSQWLQIIVQGCQCASLLLQKVEYWPSVEKEIMASLETIMCSQLGRAWHAYQGQTASHFTTSVIDCYVHKILFLS